MLKRGWPAAFVVLVIVGCTGVSSDPADEDATDASEPVSSRAATSITETASPTEADTSLPEVDTTLPEAGTPTSSEPPDTEPAVLAGDTTTTTEPTGTTTSAAPVDNDVRYADLTEAEQTAVDLVCTYADSGRGDMFLVVNIMRSGEAGVPRWEGDLADALEQAGTPDAVASARKRIAASCVDLGRPG